MERSATFGRAEFAHVFNVEVRGYAVARIPTPPDHRTFDDSIPGPNLHAPLLQMSQVDDRTASNLKGDMVSHVGRVNH